MICWRSSVIQAKILVNIHPVLHPKLQNKNLGMEEFTDHSFDEGWDGNRFTSDMTGGPLSPFHPWNKETKPRPQAPNWREKYTWATSPRGSTGCGLSVSRSRSTTSAPATPG